MAVPEILRYRNSIDYEVSGDYALFSDPITRASGEKCSYHLPTYSALVGITSSIYWKPTFMWVIDYVRIMNPIITEKRGVFKRCPVSSKSPYDSECKSSRVRK